MVDQKGTIKTLTEDLLERLQVPAQVSVGEDKKEKVLRVDLEGEDLGILIGFRGEVLSSLQVILGLLVYRKLGHWVRLLLDAGGYRKQRLRKLEGLAEQAVDRVRFLLKPVTLSPMPAFERRIIHLKIREFDDVTSESINEGRERRVVVKPINAKGAK